MNKKNRSKNSEQENERSYKEKKPGQKIIADINRRIGISISANSNKDSLYMDWDAYSDWDKSY
jgi:hypothetical protein